MVKKTKTKKHRIPKSMIIGFVIPRQYVMKRNGLLKDTKRIGIFLGETKGGLWKIRPWGIKTTYIYWKGFWKKVDYKTFIKYKKKFHLLNNKNTWYLYNTNNL